MEKLVSNWFNVQPVPEDYIFPPESRPGKLNAALGKDIPVIDLSEVAKGDRTQTIERILKAAQEFGFFQVINHGVSEKLMNETRSVLKEFFQMPSEYKQHLYSEDPNLYPEDPTKKCKLLTSTPNYATEKVHLWRDSLRHPCFPLEQWQQFWPENPATYRECVGACSVEVKKLASRILELISEGIGLKRDYFDNELSESMLLTVHHYPPCPEPSLTLGASQHADANLLTILLQDDINGLQVLKDGSWIGVEPLPNAFTVNIGYQLQIISNNKLKSVEHRVVTNSSDARTTGAFFISPLPESIMEPAKDLIDEFHPPLYKPFIFKDLVSQYVAKNGETEAVLASFRA